MIIKRFIAMGKRLWTVDDAAAFLRKHPATVRRHASEWGGKKLPGSRTWLFDPDSLRRLVTEEVAA